MKLRKPGKGGSKASKDASRLRRSIGVPVMDLPGAGGDESGEGGTSVATAEAGDLTERIVIAETMVRAAQARLEAAEARERAAEERLAAAMEAERDAADRLAEADVRERAAEMRVAAAEGREEAAEERLAAVDARERAAAERDAIANERDRAALERDTIANERDRAFADRAARPGLATLAAAGARPDAAAGSAADPHDVELELARLEAELQRAHLDALTGALRREMGRLALRNEIERARRGDGRFVIAFVDVDGLKGVNDRDGHAAGDRVLRTLAATMRANLRSYDPVVRYGGDEFVFGVSSIDEDEVRHRLGVIDQSLRQSTGCGISAGLAQLTGGETLDELTARADAALLEAKRRRDA